MDKLQQSIIDDFIIELSKANKGITLNIDSELIGAKSFWAEVNLTAFQMPDYSSFKILYVMIGSAESKLSIMFKKVK